MSAIGFKTDDFPPQISDTYGPQQMGYILRVCVCAHACAEPAKTKTPMDQGTQNAANISHKGAEWGTNVEHNELPHVFRALSEFFSLILISVLLINSSKFQQQQCSREN